MKAGKTGEPQEVVAQQLGLLGLVNCCCCACCLLVLLCQHPGQMHCHLVALRQELLLLLLLPLPLLPQVTGTTPVPPLFVPSSPRSSTANQSGSPSPEGPINHQMQT